MAGSLKEEIEALQRHLRKLASYTDDELTRRYQLERPPMPPGLYWRLRWLVGWTLRWLEAKGLWRRDPWPVGLRQRPAGAKAKPLLIWALGADRDTLRDACTSLSGQWDLLPGFAPVLITDVADFAFFSRLGWLIEYVPRLTGEGDPYDKRKLRFLARLYRNAPALPVSASLHTDSHVDDIRQWLTGGALR